MLVITEVALACVLLVGAGLLLRSFLKVLDFDFGFQPDRAAAVKVDYDDAVPTPDPTGGGVPSIKALVSHAVSPRRFFMLLVGTFAALGLFLAALGIYGVISYSVTRQTQEIGIRMALGASMGRVQREVLTSTLGLALAGIMLGAVALIFVARLISALLFATSPWDWMTYAGMALALGLLAAVSGYLPAKAGIAHRSDSCASGSLKHFDLWCGTELTWANRARSQKKSAPR